LPARTNTGHEEERLRRESGTALGTRGVLVVPIGEILFGAPVEEVAGLIEGDRITALPRQSGAAVGVLAFRGSMIPALDLCTYLDVPAPESPRYGIVLSRGTERFALLVPSLPRLVPGRELKEAEVSIADAELTTVVGSVYHAGTERIHCLRYWSIFDSVMPLQPAGRGDAATGPSRRVDDVL
jgi:chemotaxis signal transduction protein